MIKDSIILVVASILFYAIHFFMVPQWVTIDIAAIPKQHFFLGGTVLFVYISLYITSKISPTHTGFVFLGLILAKMIIAGFFVNQMGWLEEGSPRKYRAVFLCFYMLYILILSAVAVKLIQRNDKRN